MDGVQSQLGQAYSMLTVYVKMLQLSHGDVVVGSARLMLRGKTRSPRAQVFAAGEQSILGCRLMDLMTPWGGKRDEPRSARVQFRLGAAKQCTNFFHQQPGPIGE